MATNNWTNFKNQYEELEEKPSEDLWSRLEFELDNSIENQTVTENEISKQKFSFWKYAVAVVFLIIGGFVVNNYLSEKPRNFTIKNEKKKLVPRKISTENLNENVLDKSENEEIADSQNLTKEKIPVKNNQPEIISNEKISSKILAKPNESLAISKTKTPENLPKTEEKLAVFDAPKIIQKEKKSYVKADELLFGRELEKSNQHENSPRMGTLEFERFKAKSLKILGIELLKSPEKE